LIVIERNNLIETWKSACEAILAHKDGIQPLICRFRSGDEEAIWLTKFSPMSVGVVESSGVVAKVLFPSGAKREGESREDFYKRHSELLSRARKKKKLRSAWGSTYFERLISLDGSENQIERAIRAYGHWERRPHAAVTMHLSSPRVDALRVRGSPCLQYVQLLHEGGDSLDLLALYRSHDYLRKALGNFVGLNRLLRFICAECKLTPGFVTCVSSRGYTEHKTKLRQLLKN
jgi:thymidylate synthase